MSQATAVARENLLTRRKEEIAGLFDTCSTLRKKEQSFSHVANSLRSIFMGFVREEIKSHEPENRLSAKQNAENALPSILQNFLGLNGGSRKHIGNITEVERAIQRAMKPALE